MTDAEPLTPAVLQPGSRITWADLVAEDAGGMVGTVCQPTTEELAYVATWSPEAQTANRGKVVVQWDGEEPWERSWEDPADLVTVLDLMAKESAELGLYEATAEPRPTR